jgi:Ran GTPase-activating protein (RanGAP) involved in mRNA processing and transport
LCLTLSTLGSSPPGWRYDEDYETYCHSFHEEQDEAPEGSKQQGAICIANAIRDSKVLTALDLSCNYLGTEAVGKALAEALAVNCSLKELDLSSNYYNCNCNTAPEFAKALSVGLSDNTSLSSVNILFNFIGTEQAQNLASVLKEHPTLKSLCGNTGNETKLDMSGNRYKEMDAADATMLTPEIIENSAILSLHVGQNSIPNKEMRRIMAIAASKERMEILCEVPVKDKNPTALDISGKKLGFEGALVLAEYLTGNGVMLSSLTISDNRLGAEGAKVVAEALKVNIHGVHASHAMYVCMSVCVM